jgi:hypothetical protein
MNYRVEWTPQALQWLADAWLNAQDRAVVSSASNAIDTALQLDPLSQGESRDDGSRILINSPLAVLYDVDAATRTVTVWDAWLW